VLKIEEVYEKQIKTMAERPDGSEYVNFTKIMTTRNSLINPDYIVAVHPHEFVSASGLSKVEAAFPEGTKFSTLVVDGNSFRSSEILVVGSFDKFCRIFEKSPSS
jgi:hypothetical protein